MRKFITLVFLATVVAAVANPAYMQISGIPGGVRDAGREGTVRILEFTQTIETPLDPIQLTPKGRTRHGLVTFHKAFDQSSTILNSRILTQAVIPNITVKWYKLLDQEGTLVEYLRFSYSNVRIMKIRPYVKILRDDRSNSSLQQIHMEEITFSYRSMTTTFLDGNLTAGGPSSVAR